MQFKYANKTGKREATMLIYDEIGGYGINGAMFASELMWIGESGQFDQVNVRINSVGGSVFDGFSIFSAIVNCKIPVNTYIDYLAASMGGIIAMAGKKCYMAENGLLMLHNPYNPGQESPDAKEVEVLTKIKESLVSVYSGRTGNSDSFISDLMDKETWLSSAEAKKYGMIDGVFNPLVKPKQAASYDKVFLNKVSQQLKNRMEPIELEALKGELDKVKNSVSEKDAELKSLKEKNAELEAKLADKEKELETVREKEAVELVENGIKEGKFKKESRESLISSAKQNFGLVKNMYDSIQTASVARFVNVAGSGEDKKDDRSNWSYRDWEKKDQEGLKNMYVNNREQYNELLKTLK